MIGTIFYKNNVDWTSYAATAEWCNTHNASIVEYDDHYKVEPNPLPTLEELKQQKLQALSASFAHRVSGSFVTMQGYVMQFDTSDVIKMEGAIKLLEITGDTYGYLVQANDTVIHNVTIDAMRQVHDEMMIAYGRCHAQKQSYREQIQNCNTVEELNSIEFEWEV